MISPVKIWRNQKKQQLLVGKIGKIVAWTIVRTPPTGFANVAPYPVAVIEFNSGKRMTCQIVDWNEVTLAIGLKVKLVIRQMTDGSSEGIIPYGIKARPIEINYGTSITG
jgi:uncharacterized OB-fold protein